MEKAINFIKGLFNRRARVAEEEMRQKETMVQGLLQKIEDYKTPEQVESQILEAQELIRKAEFSKYNEESNSWTRFFPYSELRTNFDTYVREGLHHDVADHIRAIIQSGSSGNGFKCAFDNKDGEGIFKLYFYQFERESIDPADEHDVVLSAAGAFVLFLFLLSFGVGLTLAGSIALAVLTICVWQLWKPKENVYFNLGWCYVTYAFAEEEVERQETVWDKRSVILFFWSFHSETAEQIVKVDKVKRYLKVGEEEALKKYFLTKVLKAFASNNAIQTPATAEKYLSR